MSVSINNTGVFGISIHPNHHVSSANPSECILEVGIPLVSRLLIFHSLSALFVFTVVPRSLLPISIRCSDSSPSPRLYFNDTRMESSFNDKAWGGTQSSQPIKLQ